MSDQENRHSERKGMSSGSRGRLILIFLVALLLLVGVATAAMAEGGPMRFIDPVAEAPVPTAEDLQYARVLQGMGLNTVVPNISCFYAPPNTPSGNFCTANDIDLGTVSDIQVSDPCSGVPGDTITFTATFELISNATNRYDIGLWINTNNGLLCSNRHAMQCCKFGYPPRHRPRR